MGGIVANALKNQGLHQQASYLEELISRRRDWVSAMRDPFIDILRKAEGADPLSAERSITVSKLKEEIGETLKPKFFKDISTGDIFEPEGGAYAEWLRNAGIQEDEIKERITKLLTETPDMDRLVGKSLMTREQLIDLQKFLGKNAKVRLLLGKELRPDIMEYLPTTGRAGAVRLSDLLLPGFDLTKDVIRLPTTVLTGKKGNKINKELYFAPKHVEIINFLQTMMDDSSTTNEQQESLQRAIYAINKNSSDAIFLISCFCFLVSFISFRFCCFDISNIQPIF